MGGIVRLIIVTDAWHPQVNGVVFAIERTAEELCKKGWDVKIINPMPYCSVPMPTYNEIRLAITSRAKIGKEVELFKPDAIHICTEGPLGLLARSYCLKNDLKFTTSFHTKFPEYINKRFFVPLKWSYAYLKRFHQPASNFMVNTPSMENELQNKGFKNITKWGRGVDVSLFKPTNNTVFDFPRPIQLYVGRVALEKNIDAFLEIENVGTKVVVGDGPQLKELRSKYKEAVFLGSKSQDELADYYSSADVTVFPSKTDTLGMTNLESMACGTPVAGFPVPGPIDLIENGKNGYYHDDLGVAITNALKCKSKNCIEYAHSLNWENATEQFESNLVSAQSIVS